MFGIVKATTFRQSVRTRAPRSRYVTDIWLVLLASGEGQGGVWIHQVSRRHSQAPFRKVKGSIQLVLFHPTKPHFFVAVRPSFPSSSPRSVGLTRANICFFFRIDTALCADVQPGGAETAQDPYAGHQMDLVHGRAPIGRPPHRGRLRPETLLVRPRAERQTIQNSQVRVPSRRAPSPEGADWKEQWQTLTRRVARYHTRALRAVHFHPTYPLFASSSDDGSIQVFHARVYNDLMTNPLIVPLKILRGHTVKEGLGVLQVRWCPRQPWLVSAGADGEVAVWCS